MTTDTEKRPARRGKNKQRRSPVNLIVHEPDAGEPSTPAPESVELSLVPVCERARDELDLLVSGKGEYAPSAEHGRSRKVSGGATVALWDLTAAIERHKTGKEPAPRQRGVPDLGARTIKISTDRVAQDGAIQLVRERRAQEDQGPLPGTRIHPDDALKMLEQTGQAALRELARLSHRRGVYNSPMTRCSSRVRTIEEDLKTVLPEEIE